jgi:hypothetical protein
MAKDNSMVEAMIWIMTNYPTFGLVALCSMLLFFLTFLAFYLIAFIQGREIDLLGIRIGPKQPEPPIQASLSGSYDSELVMLLSKIDGCFTFHQATVNWFFTEVSKAEKGGLPSLISFVRNHRNEFRKGRVMGARLKYPFDFTLGVISYDGVCIDHDYTPLVETLVGMTYPFSRILTERTGEFYWQVSNFKSFSMERIINNCDTERITKIYFKHFDRLKVIVLFELHVNLIYQFPSQ